MTLTGSNREGVVRAANTVTIPANSEANVSVFASRCIDTKNLMIEPSPIAACQALWVAKTLVNLNKSRAICRVLNPTSKPIKIRKFSIMGQISPVTVIAPLNQDTGTQPTGDSKTFTTEHKLKLLTEKGVCLDETALKGNDRIELIDLLFENLELFATKLADLPGCYVDPLKLDTGDAFPFRARPLRLSPQDRDEAIKQFKEMEDANIISPSDSPYSNAYFLVSKKDLPGQTGRRRVVFDLRQLNERLKVTSFPLPSLPQIIDTVGESGGVLFTSIDLYSGFNNMVLDPGSRDRTAFITPDNRNMHFNSIPQGLSVSPIHFQKCMQKIFSGLAPTHVLAYQDDAMLPARNWQDMRIKMSEVFSRLKGAGLRIHARKCAWAVDRIKFLGHIWSKDGLSVDESKIEIIKNYARPKDARQVKAYLGLVGYYRKFCPNFAQLSAPLRKLTQKDATFLWSKEAENSFTLLKDKLANSITLKFPDFNKEMWVATDSSVDGLGYIIHQKDEGGTLDPSYLAEGL